MSHKCAPAEQARQRRTWHYQRSECGESGRARHETEADATKALRRAALASLRTGHREGYRSTRFRIAPVLAAVACLVLQ